MAGQRSVRSGPLTFTTAKPLRLWATSEREREREEEEEEEEEEGRGRGNDYGGRV
jgi:hypothetical protein